MEENFNNENQEMINKKKVLTNALSISIGIVFSVVVLFALYIVVRPQVGNNSFNSKIFTEEQLERLEKAAQIIDDDFL